VDRRIRRRVLYAALLALVPMRAAAQAVDATPAGHELNVTASSYTYVEAGRHRISIHAAKVGGEYVGTALLSKQRHLFVQADVRGIFGNATYEGWCSPWLIKPNSSSPNGYELDLGDPSPCSESGDNDWYVETRGLVGKDFIRRGWVLSPYTGVGFRYLSNGTSGAAGFRTDDYLYLPAGLTAHTKVRSRRLSVTLEYDHLLHGWQTTRNSKFGSGEVPATPTAPAFTIDGITDVSFDQHDGWSARASAKYYVTNRWSVEPYYVHWSVNDSPPNSETLSFTVNRVRAQEQLRFYEPFNVTNELGVKVGFRF
jgi:hypothetical protein